MKSIVVLGSTGSIGVNTLSVAKKFGIRIEGLVAGSNTGLLNAQIHEHKPSFVAIGDKAKKDYIDHDRVLCGDEGILELLRRCESETVVNALVGFSGVMPSLECMHLGKNLALANKESLVVAGRFLDTARIHPIDSEHFGLWYLQNGKAVSKLYITASGGALRNWDITKMRRATVVDVLKHPNWSMGSKITVDSATMVNKLFEVLEARWLFDTSRIDAYIEQKSVIHALIEFEDGSTTAHMAGVDMALPIAYALKQNVDERVLRPVDLCAVGPLELKKVCTRRYPLWQMKDALLDNEDMGVVFNAANDFLVTRFLDKQITYDRLVGGLHKILLEYENFTFAHSGDLKEIHHMVQRRLQEVY